MATVSSARQRLLLLGEQERAAACGSLLLAFPPSPDFGAVDATTPPAGAVVISGARLPSSFAADQQSVAAGDGGSFPVFDALL